MSEWSASESERRTHEEGFTGGFNPWVVALTVTLATFMEVLDTSIANVALPYMGGNLGASNDQSTWVLTSYLVSNAIDHTRAASSVKARVEKNGAGQRFLISNPSEGLAPSDVPHMFERFWQKDAARSSPDHCGLGLALARAYARSLGMKLDAELNHTEVVFILSDAAPCNGA